MDKRFLEDCLARGMSLERIGELAGKHASTVGYWVRKHGLRAVNAERHAPKGGVDERRLRELIADGASLRKAAAELGVSATTVRHWVRKLGLETSRSERRQEIAEARALGLKRAYLRCPVHGHTAFTQRPDGGFRCARCNAAGVVRWRRSVKRRLVEEAGGCCVLCGYSRYDGALHFHHLDPSQKEFLISRHGVTRSFAEARAEAGKCVLLCANCHAEVEGGVTSVDEHAAKVMQEEGRTSPK